MYEDGVAYADMSMDDLLFELKRTKQKCNILEQNKEIYLKEQELLKEHSSNSMNMNTTVLMNECNKKNAKIVQLQSLVNILYGKYAVILRNIQLERQALAEIRADCNRYNSYLSSNNTILKVHF